MSDRKQARNLRRLRSLYRKLDEAGGPEADGELFEQVLSLEEETLAMSGLAPTESNTSLLQKMREYEDTAAGVAFVRSLHPI